ncbi:MAG: hypothetical protein ACYC91_03180 [Solirubrobacteraceae bacterium]
MSVEGSRRLPLRRLAATIGIGAAAVLGLGWLLYGGPSYRSDPDRVLWFNDTAPLSAAPVGTVSNHWRLSTPRALANAHWGPTPYVKVISMVNGANPGTMVQTLPGPALYAVESPVVRLRRGTYTAVLEGRVLKGGLTLGVLNEDTQSWITTSNFWYGEPGFMREDMQARFTLPDRQAVRLVLANFRVRSLPSLWILRGARIVRMPSAG